MCRWNWVSWSSGNGAVLEVLDEGVPVTVVALRREHPGWGPSLIRWQLEREVVVRLPAGRRCSGRCYGSGDSSPISSAVAWSAGLHSRGVTLTSGASLPVIV